MNDTFNHKALDPARSVVIEACAGSGKTWLLVSRIVRLLLAGVAPSEILAITFTRKAAQEMEARLRDWLRLLALAPDAEVRDFLRERAVAGEDIDAALPLARGLFEAMLTAAPGITINTFHGWFLQLLQRAPAASGAMGAAGLLDQSSALIDEAWQGFAEDLQDQPEAALARDLDGLFRDYGLSNTRALLLAFLHKRAEWWAYTAGQPDALAFAEERLREDLQVDPDADIAARLFAEAPFLADLQASAGLLEANTAGDKAHAAKLLEALQSAEPAQRLEGVFAVFFTRTERKPRERKASDAQAKRLGESGQARLLDLHRSICERLQDATDALAEQQAYRLGMAGLRCGTALLEHYQRLKTERQVMDFTDVEWRVHRLLTHSDHAEYMQYKLDSRYRHILLDEFQDTNPLQWQVLRSWLDASSAAGTRPTVFLVGDPKQSIYRFRRAEARLFDIAADFLEHDYGAHRLAQNTTRRNAPAVLAAVNAVFAREPEFKHFQPHEAHHKELPGLVEVMPIAPAADSAPGTRHSALALRNPLAEPRPADEDTPHAVEARQLAAKIGDIVGRWPIQDERTGPRPAEHRDIMLLVRGRTHLAAYEAALKAARIPFVSSRQGGLLDTLEAGDLTALLEFLITPFADLRLARVLRSPLFAASDEDLMALAQLPEGNWWQRLRQLAASATGSAALLRAAALLEGWRELTDKLPVHDLLDRIYFEGDLLRRYEAAVPQPMHPGVLANLHAFMELALNVEAGRYPSLPRFLFELANLSRAPGQEAPDEGVIGDLGNAVRILTVHGSKGLEAPIVWLLDADGGNGRNDGYAVLLDWPPDSAAPTHFSLYGNKQSRGKRRDPWFEAEAEIARREDLNLLYVAMTRARQALIVSAASARGDDGWYAKVKTSSESCVLSAELGTGVAQDAALRTQDSELRTRHFALSTQHSALRTTLPTGTREAAGISAARRYGINLHLLLERLAPPRVAPGKAVLRGMLGMAEEEFEPLWADAMAVLGAESLRRFFDPAQYLSAYNELPYATAGGDSRRIDRLVEFEDSVWILDYKTTEAANGDLERCAAPWRGQLREYRTALQQVYPGKPVHCALIFSDARFHVLRD